MEDVVEALGGRRRIKQAGMSGLQVLSGSGSGSGCWGKVLPYHPSHLSPPREVFSGSTPSWQEAATHSPSTHSGTLCWVGLFTQKSGQKSFMRGVCICGGGVGGRLQEVSVEMMQKRLTQQKEILRKANPLLTVEGEEWSFLGFLPVLTSS